MADIKISALPGASTLTGAETIPLVQGGTTKKATASAVWTMVNPSYTGTLTGGTGVVNLGSGQFVKDASGNVGLGVTPSASTLPTIESQYGVFTGRLGAIITHNAYSDGTWKYSSTNFASRYVQQNGMHSWSTALEGTAGNAISFTQAMTLDASGDLTTANDRINLITVGRGGGGVASNTASGVNALYSNTTGSSNTASGRQALHSNTTGDYNTASGAYALYSNTTGSSNTASGLEALYSNTTGSGNTASGYAALNANTTGSSNTASGTSALRYNTTGVNNTASGHVALYSNTTGNYNTASGMYALYSNTTGASNTASGRQALHYNTTGYNNTASGSSGYNPDNDIAQYRITTDFDMTLVGYGATKDNAGQLWNSTAIGARAKVTKSNQVVLGDSNVTETLINGDLVQKVSTTAATLTANGTLTFSIVNDTTLRISVRGSDGTTRTATVALS